MAATNYKIPNISTIVALIIEVLLTTLNSSLHHVAVAIFRYEYPE